MVNTMLMSKSTLHPAMKPAAAGGKMMATCLLVKKSQYLLSPRLVMVKRDGSLGMKRVYTDDNEENV
jgi:hypothetical protein